MQYAQPSLTPFGSAWNSFHPITILLHFYFYLFIFYFFRSPAPTIMWLSPSFLHCPPPSRVIQYSPTLFAWHSPFAQAIRTRSARCGRTLFADYFRPFFRATPKEVHVIDTSIMPIVERLYLASCTSVGNDCIGLRICPV
jgi:hypothetical protein